MREHVAGVAGTVPGEVDGQACVHGLALGCRAPEIPFGILLGGFARVAVRRRARRQRLEYGRVRGSDPGTEARGGRA